MYQVYNGATASVPAVKVVVPQAARVPVMVAVGIGLMVTPEAAEVLLHPVELSVTLTLYAPLTVTNRVDAV